MSLWEKLVARMRGSSRAPDDLAVNTTRPGDFADDPATAEVGGEGIQPNPHEHEEPQQ